jgi:hypothetical protein
VDAKFTEISNNTYLPTVNKTNLANAKAAYDTEHVELIQTIEVAIANNLTTTEEKIAVDNAFAEYTVAIAALSASFEVAINAIATAKAKEAKDDALDYIDGEITTVTSTITQLADSISSKVESETFTNAIGVIETTKATKEETKAISDRLDGAEDDIEDAVKNLPYRVEVKSTNGLTFKNGDIESTVYCRVYRGTEEVTHTLTPANLIWTRISDDAEGDAAWNAAHVNVGTSFLVTPADVPEIATFECALDIVLE